MKVLFFFQTFRNFERTFTVLGEKVFGRDIKIEKCTFRLIRLIKKSNFWKFSFFSNSSELWTNNYRAWRKTFRQGYQNWKLQSSSRKIKPKIKCMKNLSLFLIFQNSERTFTVLGEKVLGRGIKIPNCTLSLQSIMLRIKIIFESFVSFPFIRTWNKTFLGLSQHSLQPGCQKGIKGVYMSPLWDVGIRSDMTWRENFFEPWRKNFDLFLKTAFNVSKGTFWVKTFFEISVFFSNFSELWTNSYCAWRESFWQGYQKWKMHFSSHKINQKIKLLKVLFFLSISSELWTNIYRAWRKSFGQGYQKWNLQSSSQKINQNSIFWKFSFFSTSSDFWTNNYRACQKSFLQGYRTWKMQSSSHKINEKIKLLEVLFFFKFFRTLNEHLPCLAKNFSAGISKLKIAVFVSSDQTKNQIFEKPVFFWKIFRTLNEHLPCLAKKFLAGVSKLQIVL